MASHHRSRSRHRSPSPYSRDRDSSSSKRSRHSYRERSRSRDRYRSSRSSHHRSSRYDDKSSRYDNVSNHDKRPHSREPTTTSRNSADASTHITPTPLSNPTTTLTESATSTTTAVDADEAQRKKLERVRKWKEQKRLEEEKKQQEKQLAAEKEAQELEQKRKEAEEEQQRLAAEEEQKEQEEEPQLLQQFAAMKKAAAEAALKEEAEGKAENDAEMAEEEPTKGWSLEDESDEDQDIEMDVEHEEVTTQKEQEDDEAEAERTFKPLLKAKHVEEENLLVKPKTTFLKSNLSTKPKNTMGFGFGNKKSIAVKKVVQTDTVKEPEPKDTVMTEPEPEVNEDIDPLEAYMINVHKETKKINRQDEIKLQKMNGELILNEDDEEGDETEQVTKLGEEDEIGSDPEDILAFAAKKVKRKDITPVDHAKQNYEFFRKDFYIEPPELKELTQDQVDLLRLELDGIKIRGVNCPKPITKWTHCGLPAGCLEVIKKLKYEKPTSIQAQAIPAIMNGRDVIGVAKTGSGKTIAFLLPMFRHIKDQRPIESSEGPVAIIMTPTRELATQIHRECKPFLKVLNLRAVCAYGGSPIKDQIADLKRGCEIIVCTPGRMIDLLCANSGRVTNLKRVTYMVMDEADRMFDMGFEPQVMKIVNNVRPSRQTVLFSATFPRQMEALARKVLKKPLEITVGGRSVVCDDVTQIVEIREEDTKFVRLLEILGQFFNQDDTSDSSALIFVDKHESADNLLRDLMRRGYPCQSLHGGKDQADRDSTISDFKSGVTNILIATSVAARGLDVKNLKLVVNYECPNHMEDYVHRVGRTGRAGNKGTAYTFITPYQDRYAMDICKALKISGQEIPQDLLELSESFQNKVKQGQERASGSGFGGKGLERLDKDRDFVKKFQKKAYGGDSDDEDDIIELESTKVMPGITATASAALHAASTQKMDVDEPEETLSAAAIAAKKAAAAVAARITAGGKKLDPSSALDENGEARPVYAEEIIINDYPQKARWRVTNKEQISQITEVSGAAITTRGSFYPPGKQPTGNDRKLYLFIEGDSEMVVEKAKNEIKRILIEATAAQMEADARGGGTGGAGRYQVV